MSKSSSRTLKRDLPLTITRVGGAALVLAGFSYGGWGYLDNPGDSGYVSAIVASLSATTPALFLIGLVGLYFWVGREGNFLGHVVFLSGVLGTALGFMNGIGWVSEAGISWWIVLFSCLTLAGINTLTRKTTRRRGMLIITSGILGWLSLLTDPSFPGAVAAAQTVHVIFAALFCLSSVVLGCALLWGAA